MLCKVVELAVSLPQRRLRGRRPALCPFPVIEASSKLFISWQILQGERRSAIRKMRGRAGGCRGNLTLKDLIEVSEAVLELRGAGFLGGLDDFTRKRRVTRTALRGHLQACPNNAFMTVDEVRRRSCSSFEWTQSIGFQRREL